MNIHDERMEAHVPPAEPQEDNLEYIDYFALMRYRERILSQLIEGENHE